VYVCRGKEASFAFKGREWSRLKPRSSRSWMKCSSEAFMILAKVIGQVIATQKEPTHEGMKILLVQALTLQEELTGDPFVAFDAVDAGIGDRVLAVQEGFSAMTSVGHTEAPIDAAIIGVVDRVELE
jgi:ethanolamine utilization protein EutN